MGNDIRLDIGFLDNIKTRKLIRELGDHAVVCTLRLWSYVALRHPKGQMNGMTQDDLEDIAGWTGERGAYVAYAIRMRWVDTTDDGHLEIHDWKEHQPWVYHSEKRSEAAKTAVAIRWENHKKQLLNTPRIRSVYKANTERNTPSPIPYPIPKDQKQDQNICARAKPARFTIPTVEEIREYCTARNNTVDPVKFHAHYTANGWRVGKNPMRNWKAAIVTWESR